MDLPAIASQSPMPDKVHLKVASNQYGFALDELKWIRKKKIKSIQIHTS